MLICKNDEGCEGTSSSAATSFRSGASPIYIERKQIQPARSQKIFACPLCTQILSSSSNLNRHLSEVHERVGRYEKAMIRKGENWIRETCPICQKSLDSPAELIRHAREKHDFSGVIQHETFANYDEFAKWKESMGRLHDSYWSRKSETTKNYVRYLYYRCYRSTNSDRRISKKRRARMRTTLHRSCTSFMKVKVDVTTGITTVEFCLEHLGHEQAPENHIGLRAESDGFPEHHGHELAPENHIGSRANNEGCSEHLGHERAPENHIGSRAENEEIITIVDESDLGIERAKTLVRETDKETEGLYFTASQDVRHVIKKKLSAISDGCLKLQQQSSKEAYRNLRKVDGLLSEALSVFIMTEPNNSELRLIENTGKQEIGEQYTVSTPEASVKPGPKETSRMCQVVPAITNGDVNDKVVKCNVCGQREPLVYDIGTRKAMIDWMLCDACGIWVHMDCAKTRECSNCNEGYLELDDFAVIVNKRHKNVRK
ncbi:hypothetical protein GCK32_005494 [Trichostrongylus colubriformis]|uniref:C2H2-type domain-containing protein n=1 Tax=Trichostrongylus colubriformis TaxID=6319 RepID=A0AAN8IK70_TRICO